MLDDNGYRKIKNAIVNRDSEQHRALMDIITTSHWNTMMGNESAFKCKIERCQYISQILGCHGKTILDFGSGMGFLANYLAATGSSHVTGIEVLEAHQAVSNFLSQNVFMVENIDFQSDISKLVSGSCDIIILANVISHINEPIQTLLSLIRTLKKGGVLFIEDNNNFASPLVRRKNRKIWLETDEVYQQKRRDYILGKFGDLFNEKEVRNIAYLSYGLTLDEIDDWARTIIDRVSPFDKIYLRERAPLDPDTNIYHENSFHPKELATLLFNLGFVIRTVKPKHVFDFKENRLVSWLFQRLPNLCLNISPAYEIIAMKL